MQQDKRAKSRRRVRFRSGKLADRNGAFLADCMIYDRSEVGARLRVSSIAAVPDEVLLFDDELASLSSARVAWRGENELGVRFAAVPFISAARTREIERQLTGKYYAL